MLSALDFRNNAIGFLRLFFAGVVVWSHAYGIGGFRGDPIYSASGNSLTAGIMAVGGFFVLSGFLITRSYERSRNVGRFLWHRCLRILPAFWVCLFLVAFVLAPIACLRENGTLAGFFSRPDSPWSYFTSNALLAINQTDIRGLLQHLPSAPAFNGSLWTLQWESLCYICVAVFGAAALFQRKPYPVIFTALMLYLLQAAFSLHAYPGWSVASEVTALLAYFAAGSCAYVLRDRIPMTWPLAFAAAVVLATTLPTKMLTFTVLPSLAYLVLFAAMKLPIRNFDRPMDLSYGVYIYAYPLQQLLVLYGFASLGFAAYFFLGLAAAMAFAMASWLAIERPALSLKNAVLLTGPRPTLLSRAGQ